MYRDVPNLLTLYPVPDEFLSEDQAERFAGRDLPTETDDSLRRELTVLRFLNYFNDSEWHQSREQLVANEISYRRNRQRLARRTDQPESGS